MDYLLKFTQNACKLSQDFYPIICLNPKSTYVLGLYSLSMYNSLTNIRNDENDLILFQNSAESSKNEAFILRIPAGSYEIEDLGRYIEEKTREMSIEFQITVNAITMKVEMRCNYIVYFSQNSIRSILGFEKELYKPGLHISEGIPQISAINVIIVECNIVKGSYRNGRRSNTLYSFYPVAPTGYKLIERPTLSLIHI